jgi:hypothetical protein
MDHIYKSNEVLILKKKLKIYSEGYLLLTS